MTDLECQLAQALRIGINMRDAQTKFFQLRATSPITAREALVKAKTLEPQFDKQARAALQAFDEAEETGR